jgi:hypothetical protein
MSTKSKANKKPHVNGAFPAFYDWLTGSSDQTENDGYHGKYDQYMNDSAGVIAAEEADRPDQHQNYRYDIK